MKDKVGCYETIKGFFLFQWVGSIDLMPNENADANIIVKPCESWTQQEEEVCRDVEGVVGSEKLDAVFCVAGGWAGGNAAAKGWLWSLSNLILQTQHAQTSVE